MTKNELLELEAHRIEIGVNHLYSPYPRCRTAYEPRAEARSKNGGKIVAVPAIGLADYPLPAGFYPHCVDLVVVVDQFPDYPPTGFFFREETEQQVRQRLHQKYGGHIFDNALFRNTDIDIKGWKWICIHYEDHKWKYQDGDTRRWLEGDNILRMLVTFHGFLT